MQGLGPYSTHIKKAEKEVKDLAKKVNDLCGMYMPLCSILCPIKNWSVYVLSFVHGPSLSGLLYRY